MGALCFNMLLYWSSGPIAKRDPADVGRAEVAQCFVLKSVRTWQDFFGGHGYDRVSNRCEQRVFLPNSNKGIPHSHNAFLQVLADQVLSRVC